MNKHKKNRQAFATENAEVTEFNTEPREFERTQHAAGQPPVAPNPVVTPVPVTPAPGTPAPVTHVPGTPAPVVPVVGEQHRVGNPFAGLKADNTAAGTVNAIAPIPTNERKA
jgi:hypothetical protein